MPNTLLVPLDGSDLSESALPVAEQLCAGLDSAITLLTSGWGSTVADLEGYLTFNAAMLGSPCRTVVIPDTFPATAIADAVRSPDDTVVMATHGRSGIGRALLGSVAEDLLRRTDTTVVLLGPSTTNDTAIVGGALIVTIDGSARSARILPVAARWAKGLELRIVVVTVSPPGADESAEELQRAATASVGFFRSEGIDAAHESLIGATAAETIIAFARQVPASLIAMGTHGRTGLGRTALGSTTIKVVHGATCPVVVVRTSD